MLHILSALMFVQSRITRTFSCVTKDQMNEIK